eukprot:c53147_g1_i1.p1 GENE.c53147_g1_i1~~c53147_g1_i1.p1  ORF type:complete len:332 (+),score=58.66 c53147_g1_i1:29-997(+)
MALSDDSTVIVAVDGSPTSRLALVNTLCLFEQTVPLVTLVTVAHKSDAWVVGACREGNVDVDGVKGWLAPESFEEAFLAFDAPMSRFLSECKTLCAERGFVVALRVLIGKSPAPVLEDYVANCGLRVVGLVVGPTGWSAESAERGEAASKTKAMGSVASHLVEHVAVPVIVSKRAMRHPDGGSKVFGLALENSANGLDASLAASRSVVPLLTDADAVVFLSVMSVAHAVGANDDQYEYRTRQERIIAFQDEVSAITRNVEAAVTISEDVSEVLMAQCEARKLDVLCMGHRSRGFLARAFSLGSVARNSLQANAACIWIRKGA